MMTMQCDFTFLAAEQWIIGVRNAHSWGVFIQLLQNLTENKWEKERAVVFKHSETNDSTEERSYQRKRELRRQG